MTESKTNVMRILAHAQIPFTAHAYDVGDDISGVCVAQKIGVDAQIVYKTLVTRGKTRALYVFVIPADEELDLKKAAKAAGEKSIEMLQVKELLANTGYIRGGCSPIGMKKAYPTFIEEFAQLHDAIYISAGKIGAQVELAPTALASLINATFLPLTSE